MIDSVFIKEGGDVRIRNILLTRWPISVYANGKQELNTTHFV